MSSLAPRAPQLFHCRLSSRFSHKPQQCTFCSGLLSSGSSQRLFWGKKIKAKKLKQTGSVEVKKKAEISHSVGTGGGSFPCFERTPELKLFVQADSHHLSRWSRWTVLFLAWDGRPSQRQTNDRLETVPACSGVVCPSTGSVKVVRGGAGGQDVPWRRQCLTKAKAASDGPFHFNGGN